MGDEGLIFDLQLFAGEKTEQATPRRREEARKKGQVFRSVDLNSAIIILASFAVVYFTFPYTVQSIKIFMAQYLGQQTATNFTPSMVNVIFLSALELMFRTAFPIMVTAALAGLITNLLQVGFILSGETLTVKLERINPIEGFKRIFSKRALVELVKSLMKIILTGYVVYKVVSSHLVMLPLFMDMEVVQIVKVLLGIVFEMAMKVGLVLLVLGVLDYLYQRWEHEQSLKMSKQEVKEEYKQIEGDPQIKSKQKQRQREMAMKRMMAEVPKADVVITNPTHFAVALKYESKQMTAPLVVAKGQDFIALRIKDIARENKVTIVENPPLARTLFYVTDIGDVIPEDLYQAVAEVLAFVYRQKKKIL
jgi:flagellar biosynthetic protein FlhB